MPESEVEVRSGAVTLAGTLTRPAAPTDIAVLCIHGSGPLDRNENLPVQRMDIFNTVAADLAPRGIATLRYDKRGCGRSTGKYYTASYGDLVGDVVAAMRFLRSAEGGAFRRIVLLGHSEGTIIAASVAASGEPLDGLVLLAPFVERVDDLLTAQAAEMEKVLPEVQGIGGALLRAYTRIAGSPAHLQAKLLRRLRATSAPTIRQGFRRLPAQQLRDLMALDPAAIYAKVRAPALLVSGAKDLQCNPADAERIAAILGPTAEAVQVPDLTHILRKDPGRHTFLSYARLLKQPMDPEVVSRVGAWLERLRG